MSDARPSPRPGPLERPGGAPAPASTPTGPPPVRAASFQVHRSGYRGGPSQGLDPRLRRLLTGVVVFGGLGLVAWWLGHAPKGPPRLLPAVVDQVKLGMTVDDLRAIGGMPYGSSTPEPDGPRQVSLQDRFDPKKKGVQVISGDPITAETRFTDGKLSRFEVDCGRSYAGPEVSRLDLLELLPALLEAKTLRRGYSRADLEDALDGPGARCALILDAATGTTEVFRWKVVDPDGRDRARFEAHVRGDVVVEHHLHE
jgi:hypothetical protein